MSTIDLFSTALLLDEKELMIVRYTITKSNVGKIQLSKTIDLLDETTKNRLKKVLRFIEEFIDGDITYIQQ